MIFLTSPSSVYSLLRQMVTALRLHINTWLLFCHLLCPNITISFTFHFHDLYSYYPAKFQLLDVDIPSTVSYFPSMLSSRLLEAFLPSFSQVFLNVHMHIRMQ